MRPKRRNRPQKQLLLHRPGVGNRQRSRLTALRVRKRLYRLTALNQLLRHRHKRLPRLRQRRAGLAPLQQRQPQFRFQRRHLLAHRGLGDEALLRAEGDAARLRDGEEIREPLQFQGSPPSFLRDETTSFLILFPNENAPRCEVNLEIVLFYHAFSRRARGIVIRLTSSGGRWYNEGGGADDAEGRKQRSH